MLPTVLRVAEVKEERVDFLFRLADESLLHLEFQTTSRVEDLYRFAGYDLKLAERYRNTIRTAVIYSGRVKEGPEGLEHGSLVYRVTNVYLNRMDGEKEYEYIKGKVERGEELSGPEMVRLVFLPLMRHRQREGEVALEAAKLAKELRDERQNFVLAAIVGLSDKYMDEGDKRRLLEVIKMTQIERWIREEGRIEGRIEGEREKALSTARAALKKGFSPEDVAEITGLSLEEVLKIKRDVEH